MAEQAAGSAWPRWAARAGGVLFAAFLALFAFDADASGPRPLDLFMHLLPALACLLVVAIAWRRPWRGALAFLALSVAYGWWAREHVQWILVVSVPLLAVAALYAWSALAHRNR